jgi:hypothetical protein
MRRPRKPTPPTTEAIDQFCAAYDDLLGRYEDQLPRQGSCLILSLTCSSRRLRGSVVRHAARPGSGSGKTRIQTTPPHCGLSAAE